MADLETERLREVIRDLIEVITKIRDTRLYCPSELWKLATDAIERAEKV